MDEKEALEELESLGISTSGIHIWDYDPASFIISYEYTDNPSVYKERRVFWQVDLTTKKRRHRDTSLSFNWTDWENI